MGILEEISLLDKIWDGHFGEEEVKNKEFLQLLQSC